MKQIKLTQGQFAQVDDEDYECLNKFKWHAVEGKDTYYAARQKRVGEKQVRIWMHREVIQTPEGLFTDHINHNGLDNRRKNLRICTHQNNIRNQKIHIDNTSGYKGVRKNKYKWRSVIYFNNKYIIK